MSDWQIKVLYLGKITVPKAALTAGLDPDLVLDWPYLGFLLQKGKRNVVVDTGISESFIIDGKAWGGYPAEGGRAFLEKALADAGVDPLDVEMVLFTHLHNDHAANSTIFEKARFIFQKDEWACLLDPLPVMNVRKDYDPALVEELKGMNCLKVDGDLELTEGIKLLKTPGHTPGSQSIAVKTKKGMRVLVGDHWHVYCMAFSQQTEVMDMQGNRHKITPAPAVYGPFIPSTLTYNYYDYYDSCYKLRAILDSDSPERVVPGHDPSLVVTGV
ncbi:MAG: N-acyl homoserine lactonase family protein [Thermodesulfobacteriota bacterium]